MLLIGKNDIPELKAMLFFSLWIIFYLGLIIYIPQDLHLTKIKIPTILMLMLMLIFLINVFHYFFYIRNKRYKILKNYFETTGKIGPIKGSIIMLIFLVTPFLQMFYFLLCK